MHYQRDRFLQTMENIMQIAMATDVYIDDEDEERPVRPKTWPPMNIIERLNAWQLVHLKMFAKRLKYHNEHHSSSKKTKNIPENVRYKKDKL